MMERNSLVDGSLLMGGREGREGRDGRGASSASPTQHKSDRLLRGLCLGLDFRRLLTSSRPNLSTSVSTLVLSFSIGCTGGTDCSLCCQQYASGLEVARLVGDFESGLRHGLPAEVRPRHVAAGFFESDRGRRASGV